MMLSLAQRKSIRHDDSWMENCEGCEGSCCGLIWGIVFASGWRHRILGEVLNSKPGCLKYGVKFHPLNHQLTSNEGWNVLNHKLTAWNDISMWYTHHSVHCSVIQTEHNMSRIDLFSSSGENVERCLIQVHPRESLSQWPDQSLRLAITKSHWYKYYVFGHYPLSRLCLKCRPVYISKHNVSETGFCLHLQVKPTQLGPIDRASLHLGT
jgi:hypothetical protein